MGRERTGFALEQQLGAGASDRARRGTKQSMKDGAPEGPAHHIIEVRMPADGDAGAPKKRREGARFLTGEGRYADDINMRGQVYA
jgi:hypothetical protein